MTRTIQPRQSKTRRASASPSKLSRQRRPDDMTLEQWQAELRRQFGRSQSYRMTNRGEHPVFSLFSVINPQSKRTYQVTLRPRVAGHHDHHCTCPDFAVNTLGTCKHVEFVLGRLESQAGTRRMLRQAWEPEHSEVFVRYASRRQMVLRAGAKCPARLRRAMSGCFDGNGVLTETGYARLPEVLAKAEQ